MGHGRQPANQLMTGKYQDSWNKCSMSLSANAGMQNISMDSTLIKAQRASVVVPKLGG